MCVNMLCFTGYGGPAGVPNGQLAKAANSGKCSCSVYACVFVLSGFPFKFGLVFAHISLFGSQVTA